MYKIVPNPYGNDAVFSKIEATEIMAIIEAQALTEGGKFSYKGHEFVLDHVDHFRVKCLD